MNTTGNSSPLAACSVISVTLSVSVSQSSVSFTSQARSRYSSSSPAAVGFCFVELAGVGQQFLDVRQPVLILLIVALGERRRDSRTLRAPCR